MDIYSKYLNVAGIYKLTCNNNGKIYIGKSINISDRIKVYRRGKNAIGNYLKNAIIKHGWDSFAVEVLEVVESFDKVRDNDKLLKREAYYIELFDATDKDNGYNICKYSTDKTGMKMSDEFKEKCRKANLGKKLSDETRAKMSQKKLSSKHKEILRNVHVGRKCSEETKEKMRISSSKPKTTPVSEEHRRNLSKAGKGRVFTPEHRENLRLSAIKRGISKETREKMRKTNTGRVFSDEHKEKLRISALNRKSKMKEL